MIILAGKRTRPRTCVGCGESTCKKELLRIVRNSEGKVKIDLSGRAPGRGAYICPDIKCLSRAKTKKTLEKALKINVSSEIYDQLEELIKAEDKQVGE